MQHALSTRTRHPEASGTQQKKTTYRSVRCRRQEDVLQYDVETTATQHWTTTNWGTVVPVDLTICGAADPALDSGIVLSVMVPGSAEHAVLSSMAPYESYSFKSGCTARQGLVGQRAMLCRGTTRVGVESITVIGSPGSSGGDDVQAAMLVGLRACDRKASTLLDSR